MNASGWLVTLSGGQLIAILFFGIRLGRGLQKRDDRLDDHGRRIGIIEPKLDKIDERVNILRGGNLGRRNYDPVIGPQHQS